MASSAPEKTIQSSGLTTLVLLTLSANALMVGFIYHYHHQALLLSEEQHKNGMAILTSQVSEIRESIRLTEGMSTWEETEYFKTQVN